MKIEAFMTLKIAYLLVFIAMLLTACAGSTSSPPNVATEKPIADVPTSNTIIPYLLPPIATATQSSAYPAPDTYLDGTPVSQTSGYEPQPGDQNLKRDQVLLDLGNSQIIDTATVPNQVKAILNGNLSDPCHLLRVVVKPPDTNNTINLEVYSLVNPNVACVAVIQPFSATIPLGSFTSGQYTVMVNGEKLGEFDAGYTPYP